MKKLITFFAALFLTQSPFCRAASPPSLDQYLQQQGAVITEGHICRNGDEKVIFFKKLLHAETGIQNIGEIGFNAGHSSDLFLSTKPRCTVVSFDIMEHSYSKVGKRYIDAQYPGRHTIIEGNSLISVPDYSRKNPSVRFDLIFIDGGHDFNTAYSDIKNMRKLASPHTLVVIDDINYPDVSAAWKKCVYKNYVKEIQRFEHKNKVWVVGKYVFSGNI